MRDAYHSGSNFNRVLFLLACVMLVTRRGRSKFSRVLFFLACIACHSGSKFTRVQFLQACVMLVISGGRSKLSRVLFLLPCIILVTLAQMVMGALVLLKIFDGCLCLRLGKELVRVGIGIESL